MNALSDRAEQIAAHLVAHEIGATAVPYDHEGRQAAVDFLLEWPAGRTGALEVTLVTEQASMEWQGLAMRDHWTWPARTSWEFRPREVAFPYKHAKRASIRAVELCDQWGVDSPSDLPGKLLASEPEVTTFLTEDIGTLRRTPFTPGITLYPATTADFVEASPVDFSRVVESWLERPHLPPHVEKVERAPGVSERHLFVVVVGEALPVRFFTDDFEAPTNIPRGFAGVDALWIWSEFWHRSLQFRRGHWRWIPFPPA